MKRRFLVVLAALLLAVLTGCATMPRQDGYFDSETTTLIPDSAIEWASVMEQNAGIYARQNSNEREGAQFNRFYAEFTKQAQQYILQTARSSQEELEQLGKKVTQNPNADVNPMYKRLEQRLRMLPPGTRLVFGGTRPNQHQGAVVAFLSDDGSFKHYVVED
jgi:hypothetical protein